MLRNLTESGLRECRTSNSRGKDRNKPCLFPWRFEGKTYDGSIEGRGGRWCSTKLRDGTLDHDDEEDQWGYCQPDCPSSGPPLTTLMPIVFTVEEANILKMIDGLRAERREKLVCADNPCEEGSLWWEHGDRGEEEEDEEEEYDYQEYQDGQLEDQCYPALNMTDMENQNCAWKLETEGSLQYLVCDMAVFELFSLSPGPGRGRKCRRGKIYSTFRRRCVKNRFRARG